MSSVLQTRTSKVQKSSVRPQLIPIRRHRTSWLGSWGNVNNVNWKGVQGTKTRKREEKKENFYKCPAMYGTQGRVGGRMPRQGDAEREKEQRQANERWRRR